MSQETEISIMKSEHVMPVYAIGRECFSKPWTYDDVMFEVGNEKAISLVALYDGEVVGFVNARFILEEGSINNIAVTKEYRNLKLGTALIQKLVDIGRQRGVQFFTLEVRKSNNGAINFYKRIGFKEVGNRKGFYESPVEDALLLRLDVPLA